MQRSFVLLAASALVIGLLPPPAMAVEPVPATIVTAVQPLARIDGGVFHTLFVAPDGRVAATGGNDEGQLGDGTTTDRLVSVFVENLTDVVAVAAGGFHSLALDSSGRVWAWGDNGIGQLGDGTTTDRSVPVEVEPTNLTGVVAIAAGFVHSLALRSDGTVWAWGNDRQGQLGHEGGAESHVPVQVDDTNLTGVVEIAAGEGHSLAIDANGDAWGWGFNAFGQVGDGTSNNIRSMPVRVDDTNLTDVVAIAAGGDAGEGHSLAIDANGAVWAWGADSQGQLGDGTSSATGLVPVQVDDTNLTGAVAIAAGGWFSLGLDSAGNVWAWGYNVRGQLGDGTTTNRNAPVPVIMTDMDQANDIGAGLVHSLAIEDFPNESWAAWAWGSGSRGQLGSARITDFSEPIPVTRPFES